MKKSLILLFISGFFATCGDKLSSDDHRISIQWEAPALSYGNMQVVPLASESSVLIGKHPCYITHITDYFIVADADKVILFDKQGNVSATIAARGRGPQEAFDLRFTTVTDSTVLISDIARKRMLEFDFDGIFRRVWLNERPFHNFTWFADAFLLDNQTGMHHDDCVLPVCNAEGEIIRTPAIPIVGKRLNWPSAFFLAPQGCYYLPALQNDLYLVDRNYETQIAYSFDFGKHTVDPETCERYAEMENRFVAFDDYLRSNDKIAFITFARTDKWLQLGFTIGGEKRYNWFYNLTNKRQYLVPITAAGTSPWNHPVIGAEDDRFIVKVEAADYRRWPDCAVEGLAEDANPVLLLCAPQED